MLDKKDLESIEKLIQNNVKKSLIEFYETLLVPYFDQNEKEHQEIKEQLSITNEHVKDHQGRIRKLEVITSAQ